MDKHTTIAPEGLDRAILVWMQELAPNGVCATDAQLRIQGWNTWMESASGLKRKDVVGRSLLEIFPDLASRKLDIYFTKALKGEVSVLAAAFHRYLFPFPCPLRESGFSNMLQTARIAPLVQGDTIVGTITTIEDVTEREYQSHRLRKQAERQELFTWALAHLLQASDAETMVKRIFPRVAAHLDLDVYFTYLSQKNGKELRLHSAGGVPESLLQQVMVRAPGECFCEGADAGDGTFILSNIQDSQDEKADKAKELGLQAYVCHRLQVGERLIGTLSFGSRRRKAFDSAEIECSRIVAKYVAIALERLRNLQALQTAREELSQHAESLEKTVQDRTARLQESIGELESFSYSLAHDVRAPLRHIQGYARLLVEDCGGVLPDEARTYVDSIVRSIRKLDSLTQDILAYSQLSRQSIQMLPVDLDGLLHDIIARNPALGEPDVVTIQSPLEPVIGERVLLDQCLSNLLDNALKFVPEGHTPRIEVRTERLFENGQQWVEISVQDNGIGIDPEFHTRIFGIFERLATHSHGTGIGLAIVAKAIERMNGKVGVESNKDTGSRFWLKLPAAS